MGNAAVLGEATPQPRREYVFALVALAAFGAAAGSEPNSDLPPPKAIEVATALTYCREHQVSWTYWDYDGPTSLIFMNGQPKPVAVVSCHSSNFLFRVARER